ncbi:acyltransferase [Aquipseudomonas campi]
MDINSFVKGLDPASLKVLERILNGFSSMSFLDGERQDLFRDMVVRQFISQVMTDDERAAHLGLPNGCRVRENVKIISPENFTCGENVWVGEGAVLDASGGLDIGSHTSIGLSVYVWSHTSYLTNLAMANQPGSQLIERKKTRVGSGCFIAGPCTILHGVNIGDKCVVLPMSVVNKDVPSYSMVAGNPARVIKTISEEYIQEKIAQRTS